MTTSDEGGQPQEVYTQPENQSEDEEARLICGIKMDTRYPRSIEGILKIVTVVSEIASRDWGQCNITGAVIFIVPCSPQPPSDIHVKRMWYWFVQLSCMQVGDN